MIAEVSIKGRVITTALEPQRDHVGKLTGRYDYVVSMTDGYRTKGYRATLPKCDRDDCASGAIRECRTKLNDRKQHAVDGKTSVDAWLRHSKTHCHGWHDASVADFVAAVGRTLGQKARRPTVAARISHPTWSPQQIAEALGVPVSEYLAQIAAARGVPGVEA
jgi:hypothetical protein